MASSDIRPWGIHPTPLLPKTLVEELGHLPAPATLKDVLDDHSTLAELNGQLWDQVDSVSEDCLREIVEIVRPRLSLLRHLVIRSGEPLNNPVQHLPFSTRTLNAVSRHLEKFASRQLTFGEILSVPSFGVRSAIEFACVLEAAIGDTKSCHDSKEPLDLSKQNAMSSSGEINSVFQSLAAYAAGERNLETLADVLPTAPVDWPPEIEQLWANLGNIKTRETAGELAKRYSVPALISLGLSSIDRRLREILTERIFVTGHVTTLEKLGERQGITRERVRQLEKKAVQHLERFRNAEFGPVIRRSKALRERLGVGLPVADPSMESALAWVCEDQRNGSTGDISFVQALLLWLAGPYKIWQNWLLADQRLPMLTLDALLAHRDERGLISEAAIAEVLSHFGFRTQYHLAWIRQLRDFLRVAGGVVYFKGSMLEKVRVLIRYHDRPLTVEEMLGDIGGGSVRSLKQRLIDDPGFWRINKQSQFVIAGTPDYDEYTGITDEIVQELESSGGQAPFDYLVEKISRIYGVKESSVVAYLNTPMFTKDDNGIVRVRDAGEGIDVSSDITKTAACYQANDGSWYWRVLVDKDLVRGSGRLIPNAYALVLGCKIGDKIEVESECGPITISWPLASTTGASIGSLRRALAHSGAELGDYLFVKATKPLVSFECLTKATLEQAPSDVMRLALLLGCAYPCDDVAAIARIAEALGVSQYSDEDRQMESHRLLRARGEAKLAEMIPPTTLSVDDHISKMKKLFNR